ncbi:NLR family CARD domain-containing protein 3-like isoform X2 [Brachyhypopomus gauderio]
MDYKSFLKDRCENIFEDMSTMRKTFLEDVYTELYIIEGRLTLMNEEHEIWQTEKFRTQIQHNRPISYNNIFTPPCESNREGKATKIRTVLTIGIAGIGKTVTVQKFVLDWAKGQTNLDVDLMFLLPFRELNLVKGNQYSLHSLLVKLHPELESVMVTLLKELKIMFILDGLDENRLDLDFAEYKNLSDPVKESSVDVVLVNIIKGKLLPKAYVWITSRPAAVSQIPFEYIDHVTEIQGFNDLQKEKYFRKSIIQEDQANRIISHIKQSILYSMCYIPVFCWIVATVLQQMFLQNNKEIPTTLTGMYIHFLLMQTNMKNKKYNTNDERDTRKLLIFNKQPILKLAELAFKQLVKGNVLFYEEDLRECNIDVNETSAYSGICTEIFKVESVLYQYKVYCFVHLSFQEFLAAFYVFHCYVSKNIVALRFFLRDVSAQSTNVQLDDLLKRAVDKSLIIENGRLDLFLRFLLGISLESNQRLLLGVLTHTEKSSEIIKTVADHIKTKMDLSDENILNDRRINLFHCLSEMNDKSVRKEVLEVINSDTFSKKYLTPAYCSIIAYMLQVSEQVQDEFNLQKYNTSSDGLSRLIPAVYTCRKAMLADFSLTEQSFEIVSLALQSPSSHLKQLDFGNSFIQDSGVELLSTGLKDPHCKLEILRLPICGLTEKSIEIMAAVLSSTNLRELDLSNNDLCDSGVMRISAGLSYPNCKLEILRLTGCLVTKESCSCLASALISNPSHLKELDLTYNHLGASDVKLLSARREDPNCKLTTLSVNHPEPGNMWMRRGLRKYARKLTLDPNTANKYHHLSKGNTAVAGVWPDDQLYPDHPERFMSRGQVLCRESMSGRCYWEFEFLGEWGELAVAYKGISRKGENSHFGHNEKSWCVYFSGDMWASYSAFHNGQQWRTNSPLVSNRYGVYLDWQAGTLSVYNIGNTPHRLHPVCTICSKFTEPLYAGFTVHGGGCSLTLCPL